MAEISLQAYLDEIERMVEQGRYDQAVAHGKHILKQYPKHLATYRALGRATLEGHQDEYAMDMFRRVLSADPEDLVAWVGMSEIHNGRGELQAATWCLERAFELASDNEVIAEELRHLYGRRDGVEPERIQLTRGALGRLYVRGDLLSRAINEFRALLAEHPDRVDLSVALAEALWRNEQRLEAAEVCQQLLDELPYCLKANLILGEIWTRSGREEGRMYLQRAEAMDPENQVAQDLFGTASPLPAREVQIAPLEYKPPTEVRRPAWMEEPLPAGPEAVPSVAPEGDVSARAEAPIEMPSWLEEGAVPSVAAGGADEAEREEAPAPLAGVPAWLAGVREGLAGEPPEAIAEEEEGELSEWLAQLGRQPAGVEEGPGIPFEEEQEWPAGPEAQPAVEEAPAQPPAELPGDWLTDIRDLFAQAPETPEEEALAAEAEEMAAEGEIPLPPWLQEGAEMPSGDEALAWLEQLAAGKEEELAAQAEAEAEKRMAEILGHLGPTEAPPVEETPPVEAGEAAPAVEEVALPPVGEAFGWTAFGEPEAPPEAIAAAEEAAISHEWHIPEAEEMPTEGEIPLPPWLQEGVEMPSGDEALVWLEQLAAGKEEALAAQAEAEAERRMAEILGHLGPMEAPPVEETPPVEVGEAAPAVEEIAPSPAEEAVGWAAFGEPEAPPEAVVAAEQALPVEVGEAVPVVEEAAPFVEAALPPAPPLPRSLAEAPAEPLATERTYLRKHPRDYEAWLALGRALWQLGQRQEALEAYTRIVRPGKLLDSVITDLERYVRQSPDASTQRVLGDAYMKDGRLHEALDVYRRALEAL